MGSEGMSACPTRSCSWALCARTVSPVCTATGGRQRRKLRLKEVQASPGHTASKWQDCNLEAAPCLARTTRTHVTAVTLHTPWAGQHPRCFARKTAFILATALRVVRLESRLPEEDWRRRGLPEHTRPGRGRARLPACAPRGRTALALPRKEEVEGRGFQRGRRARQRRELVPGSGGDAEAAAKAPQPAELGAWGLRTERAAPPRSPRSLPSQCHRVSPTTSLATTVTSPAPSPSRLTKRGNALLLRQSHSWL